MRIVLVRHGKPSFELKGYVQAKALSEIAKSYDLSGIVGDPPAETVLAVQGSLFIVCSHLTRSVESARALGFSDVHIRDPLFRESRVPHFGKGSISLPVSVWIVLLRLLWLFGFSSNGESFSNAKIRAKQAALRLIELAEEHQDILLVGHGFINHFISKELKIAGWNGPAKLSKDFWGYGIYERAT